MIYRSKTEFMEGLKAELSKNNISGQQDILLDFEQHFTEGASAGETEEQVCEKLGDPQEIAKQYIEEAVGETAAKQEQPAQADGFAQDAPQQAFVPAPVPQPQKKSYSPDSGAVVGVILVDVLVFSWALPTLFSLVTALYGLALGFGLGGLATSIAGTVMNFIDISSWFSTGLSPISTILFGLMMAAGGALLVLASIAATVGFINVILRIINWHSNTFAGKDVCRLIGKKYRKTENKEAAK